MLTVVHITADDMLDSLSPAQRRTAVAVTTEHGNYVAFLFNADDLGPIKTRLAQRGWLSGNWNWQANHKAMSASTASNALTRKAALGGGRTVSFGGCGNGVCRAPYAAETTEASDVPIAVRHCL
jgi:hypothetical protein